MIDDSLYNQRDEYFDDIQAGDLVYYQGLKGEVKQGWAKVLDHPFHVWHIQTDHQQQLVAVIEDDNYLGHINRNQLNGLKGLEA